LNLSSFVAHERRPDAQRDGAQAWCSREAHSFTPVSLPFPFLQPFSPDPTTPDAPLKSPWSLFYEVPSQSPPPFRGGVTPLCWLRLSPAFERSPPLFFLSGLSYQSCWPFESSRFSYPVSCYCCVYSSGGAFDSKNKTGRRSPFCLTPLSLKDCPASVELLRCRPWPCAHFLRNFLTLAVPNAASRLCPPHSAFFPRRRRREKDVCSPFRLPARHRHAE